MQKTTALFLVSMLLISGAAIGTLYEFGKLKAYLPKMHRFLETHLPEKISILESSDSGESGHGYLKSPLESLKEEILKFVSNGNWFDPIDPNHYLKNGGSETRFDEPPVPEKKPEPIYTWPDEQGLTHFSNVHPRKDYPTLREIPFEE